MDLQQEIYQSDSSTAKMVMENLEKYDSAAVLYDYNRGDPVLILYGSKEYIEKEYLIRTQKLADYGDMFQLGVVLFDFKDSTAEQILAIRSEIVHCMDCTGYIKTFLKKIEYTGGVTCES